MPRRFAVPVGQPDRDDRPGDAVSDENRPVLEQFSVQRTARIMDFPFQLLDQLAVAIDDAGDQDIGAILNLYSAPGADPDFAVCAFFDTVKGEGIDWFAIDRQFDLLASEMLDGDTQRLDARIMIFRREQPADTGRFASDPVATGTSSFRVRQNDWFGIVFRDFYVSGSNGLRPKIGPLQGAAAAFDKTRNIAAGAARVLRAIHGSQVGREGGRVDLYDMQAGPKSFEMIATIAVGNGVGSVLQHHPNMANAGGCPGISGTATIGNPADQGESF